MVVSQFSMLLDNPGATYVAGQTVTGKLVLVVATESESFESIRLECTGFTKVNFTKTIYEKHQAIIGGDLWTIKTKDCMASKEHFKVNIPLMAASDGNQLKFDIGQHSFPFSFKFPNSIPSSFEGEHGHIRYVLFGILNPIKKKDEQRTIRMNIGFNKLVDLNLDPVAKMPASGTMSMNFRSWFGFRKGPVTAKAWIDQSGYAPGQILYFNASVENLSKKKMEGSTVQLIQKIVYHVQGERKELMNVIGIASHGTFGSSDVWENFQFLIPHVAPSDEHLSDHMKISYRIEFTVLPGSCSYSDKRKLKSNKFMIPLNVIIGSIPISSPVSDIIPLKNPESAMVPLIGDGATPKHEDCSSASSSVMGNGDGAGLP